MLIGAQKSGVLDVHINIVSSSFPYWMCKVICYFSQPNKTNKPFWSGDSLLHNRFGCGLTEWRSNLLHLSVFNVHINLLCCVLLQKDPTFSILVLNFNQSKTLPYIYIYIYIFLLIKNVNALKNNTITQLLFNWHMHQFIPTHQHLMSLWESKLPLKFSITIKRKKN